MTSRHILTLTIVSSLALVAGGCNLSHGTDDPTDGGADEDAGDGVCCPIADFVTPCSAGSTPLPGGGWASSLAACSYTVSGFDIDYQRTTDERGCAIYLDTGRCCGCVDAGPPPPPPPPPSECEGLGAVACLNAGCVPTFHDQCCSSCEPGAGCADCIDLEYWTCRTYGDACEATYCSTAAPWGCGGAPPDCSGASPTDGDSCSVPGCVPATAAEGSMDPLERCVPITANSCTVACRALPPECPDGTAPEGDGSCWTGRCIPGWICAP